MQIKIILESSTSPRVIFKRFTIACLKSTIVMQGNVAEVQYLRSWLMKPKYITVFR